jgi:cytochrome P450
MAGSDSVSVALSWCFHLLAHHPEVQIRLRKELSDFRNPSIASRPDELDANSGHALHIDAKGSLNTRQNKTLDDIAYLDYFVKEALRFCPPVHATIRVAKKDDLIPVSSSVTLSNGDTVIGDQSNPAYIEIRKGTYIHVPIEGLSYSEDLWGADASEFRFVVLGHLSYTY